jgi:hypothetical protein
MKSLLALSTVALLGLSLTACGGAGKGTDSAPKVSSDPTAAANSGATTSARAPKDANDGENDANIPDDTVVLDYGVPASAADTRAIVATLKRYYAAAAADDGAKVCSMLLATVAEAMPEQYALAPGVGGKTCAVVMSRLFKRRRRQMATELASLEATSVRIGEQGLVVLRVATTREPRLMVLRREGQVWKVKTQLDLSLP